MPKYEPAPTPSKLEHVLEFLAREFRRLASHTHEELYWDDQRAPASAIRAGATAPPDWDVSKGGWLFDQTIEQEVEYTFQLPHSWAQTNVRPHVHWEKTVSATGHPAWQIMYQWMPLHASRTAEATLSAAVSVQYTAGADWQMLAAFGDITASASTKISDSLRIRLIREAGAATDNYSHDARLVELDLHIQHDSPGSVYLYTKR